MLVAVSFARMSFEQRKAPRSLCPCVGDTCACCADVDIPEFDFNEIGCVNFSYIPGTSIVMMRLTYV
jgi:hypothetical protein